MLQQERKEMQPPPASRWGGQLLRLNQKALFVGGWIDKTSAEDGGARHCVVPRGEYYMLDMEAEVAKRRRLEREFRDNVERERCVKCLHLPLPLAPFILLFILFPLALCYLLDAAPRPLPPLVSPLFLFLLLILFLFLSCLDLMHLFFFYLSPSTLEWQQIA